jgi:ParB family chromosome partitioning protein
MARTKLLLMPAAETTGKLTLQAGSCTITVDQIKLRKNSDTRPLNAAHVVTLAESIAVLGLLEPIVLDTQGNLLAGGHRLAALQLLAEPMPVARRTAFLERCRLKTKDKPTPELDRLADRLAMLGEKPLPRNKITVQVIDVAGKDIALAVEAAENNVRRQYTREEIEALADRFKAAGYKTSSGKPKKGEKTMLNALEAAVGRSKRQIQNILSNKAPKKLSEWDRAMSALKRVANRVIREGENLPSEKAVAIVAVARQALKALG